MLKVLNKLGLSSGSAMLSLEHMVPARMLSSYFSSSDLNLYSQISEKDETGQEFNSSRRKWVQERIKHDLACMSSHYCRTSKYPVDRYNGKTEFRIQGRKNCSKQPFCSCIQHAKTTAMYSKKGLLNCQDSITKSCFNQHNRTFWNIYKKNHFGDYAVLDKVGEVSDPRSVPPHIICPPYAETGQPPQGPRGPEIKASWQVDSMRKSCEIARSILNTVGENIKVGMTTEDIDVLVHNKIIESGAYPSPLNYQGFPKSVCTSVNNVACHGIPDDRQLLDGDIISVDVTVYYNGYHGDCCETYLVGNVDESGRHLVQAARRCRDEAIAMCRPGVPFNAVGAKVEEIAKEERVTVVPCFVGHGIGQYFHGPPDIYHCYNDYPGTMEEGMTFTIEPIVAQGSEEVVILEDGWTAVMLDNGRAAQFEHTILITGNGHEILSDYF